MKTQIPTLATYARKTEWTEKQFERHCAKKAKSLNVLAYKFQSPSNRGVPDMLFIFPSGETIYIEFKSPKGTGKLSTLQVKTIARLKKQKVNVYVIDKPQDFDAVIRKHLNC